MYPTDGTLGAKPTTSVAVMLRFPPISSATGMSPGAASAGSTKRTRYTPGSQIVPQPSPAAIAGIDRVPSHNIGRVLEGAAPTSPAGTAGTVGPKPTA